MELLDFKKWYDRERETKSEDNYLAEGVVAEINHRREKMGEKHELETSGNELDSQLAKLLHMLDLGLFSVINGKLGHLPDLDPFKEHVRAGLLFAATFMKKYLDIVQPGFHEDMRQYEAKKKRAERTNKIIKAVGQTKKKTGEQMLQTFNRIRNSQGTKASQGNRGTKSTYRLYDGPLRKAQGIPPSRSGFALCSRYAQELVVCSMKCPTVDSESDKAGRRHRKRSNKELKLDVEKAIEQRFATPRKIDMEKDEYKLIQQIAYHYRSLDNFVLEQHVLCNEYFRSHDWKFNVEGAVERSLGVLRERNITMEPLAYSLKDTMNALRYFSVLTREIDEDDQVATNRDYVEAVLDCMKSSFMYDPFDERFGKMVAGKKENKKKEKNFVEKLVGDWRQDRRLGEEQEQEQEHDNI